MRWIIVSSAIENLRIGLYSDSSSYQIYKKEDECVNRNHENHLILFVYLFVKFSFESIDAYICYSIHFMIAY